MKNGYSPNRWEKLALLIGPPCVVVVAFFMIFLMADKLSPIMKILFGCFLVVLFVGLVMLVGKRYSFIERSPSEKDPQTFQRIAQLGVCALMIGGLLSSITFGPGIILGLPWVLAGVGLIKKTEWGRLSFIALAGFCALGMLLMVAGSFIVDRPFQWNSIIIYVVASIFAAYLLWGVFFLMQPRTKEALRLARDM